MTLEPGQKTAVGTRASRGSYWPIGLAMALTLAVVGMIVHPMVSVLGLALSLVAVASWSVQRFQTPGPVLPAQTIVETAVGGVGADSGALAGESTPPGRWGLVWFIASEAVFFANLIAAYLYLRLSSTAWPPTGMPHLEILFPSVNTAILLLSGVPAYYAERSIRRGDRRGLQIGLALAALLGAAFLAGQGYEYSKLGFTPQINAFASGFFVLTGFHGAHVVAGIGLLLAVLVQSLRGRFSARSHFAVEVAGTYWHFVDVVWIALFTTLYLAQ